MKKLLLVITIIAAVGFTSCNNKKAKEASKDKVENVEMKGTLIESTFTVEGTCENCKPKIEDAAKSVHGVKSAVWDVDSKQLKVEFYSGETDLTEIHKTIAAKGYSTDQVKTEE